jgi:hypothetical protein
MILARKLLTYVTCFKATAWRRRSRGYRVVLVDVTMLFTRIVSVFEHDLKPKCMREEDVPY